MSGLLCSAKLESPLFDAFSNAIDGQYIYICDVKSNVWRWSKDAVSYFGLPDEYVYDFPAILEGFIHPEDLDRVFSLHRSVFNGDKTSCTCEFRIQNADGNFAWVTCKSSIVYDEDGTLCAGSLTRMGQKNKFDPVTGLYSIYEFEKLVEKIEKCCFGKCGLMLFSIDYFRKINDVYDYDIGNKLLFMFAKKLLFAAPQKSLLYRLNGDQFALWHDGDDENVLNSFFNQIVLAGKEGIMINGQKICFTATAGAISCPNSDCTPAELYSSLEYTFEYGQKSNRGQITFFSRALYTQTFFKSAIKQRLRECVRNNFEGFYICYQPLISMEKEIDPIGAEALLRWNDAVYGQLPPSEFIPLLEETRDIEAVGRWVLSQAIKQVKAWQRQKPYMKASVNVSFLQFRDTTFKQFVMEEIEKNKFPKRQLILELTESCDIMYPAEVEEQLAFFRKNGIQIALDDFGTGYASLSVLRDLSADWIKVDHSFVGHIANSSFDKALTETLINLCKRLGIHVCVEGIETKEIEEIIKNYNPAVFQGYYYSKPIVAEEFESLYMLDREND